MAGARLRCQCKCKIRVVISPVIHFAQVSTPRKPYCHVPYSWREDLGQISFIYSHLVAGYDKPVCIKIQFMCEGHIPINKGSQTQSTLEGRLQIKKTLVTDHWLTTVPPPAAGLASLSCLCRAGVFSPAGREEPAKASSSTWSTSLTGTNLRRRLSSGDLRQVPSIGLGDDDLFDPGPELGDGLLLQAADGQDLAPQGDLPGHGHVPRTGILVRRKPGRWPSCTRRRGRPWGWPRRAHGYGCRAFHKDLQADRRARPGAGIAQGRLTRLLHDVPQLPGELQMALASHQGGLDRQGLTPYLGPGEPCGHANFVLFHLRFRQVLGRPKVAVRDRRVTTKGPFSPSANLRAILRHRGRSPAPSSQPRLLGVVADYPFQGLPGYRQVFGVKPFSVSCPGSRWRLMITIFSSSV